MFAFFVEFEIRCGRRRVVFEFFFVFFPFVPCRLFFLLFFFFFFFLLARRLVNVSVVIGVRVVTVFLGVVIVFVVFFDISHVRLRGLSDVRF